MAYFQGPTVNLPEGIYIWNLGDSEFMWIDVKWQSFRVIASDTNQRWPWLMTRGIPHDLEHSFSGVLVEFKILEATFWTQKDMCFCWGLPIHFQWRIGKFLGYPIWGRCRRLKHLTIKLIHDVVLWKDCRFQGCHERETHVSLNKYRYP